MLLPRYTNLLLRHIPEFFRLLATIRDFLVKTNKIDNVAEIITNSKAQTKRRLGPDAPGWISVCCQQAVLNHIRADAEEDNYDNRFSTIDFDIYLPFDMDSCYSILDYQRIVNIEKARAKEIEDCLHIQCILWFQETAELNKAIKKKDIQAFCTS